MEAASVTIVTTPPIKESGSRKTKREVEEGSPSAEAVSEPNLKQTAPIIFARWKAAAYKDNSTSTMLAETKVEMETTPGSWTEENFKPQRVKTKKRVHQWADMGSGWRQGVDLESTSEHRRTSRERYS